MSTEQIPPATEGALSEEVRAAIERHLPAETVGVLRKRLERLASVEGELAALTKTHGTTVVERDRLNSENLTLRDQRRKVEMREDVVAKREQDCTLREEKCRHREEVIDLKEAHAKERVSEMRAVVCDVFSNNRFKYREHGTVPVAVTGMAPGPIDQYGNQRQDGYGGSVAEGKVDRRVEGEGTPS